MNIFQKTLNTYLINKERKMCKLNVTGNIIYSALDTRYSINFSFYKRIVK